MTVSDIAKKIWGISKKAWDTLWKWFRSCWTPLPIVGQLAQSSPSSHLATFKEFAVILPCATLTFWLVPIFLMLFSNLSYGELVHSTMRSGELLIFAVGFMGPILNIAIEGPKGGAPFPGHRWHIVFLFLMVAAAVGIYAGVKAVQNTNPNAPINVELLFTLSIILAIGAVGLRYLSMVYRNNSLRERDFKKQENDLLSEFGSKHGGGTT